MGAPNVNDPDIIDGFDDGEDLLGWDDDAPLLPWETSSIPGEVDTSTDPLGGPVGERVYLVTATLVRADVGLIGSTEDGPIASHPVAGFASGAGGTTQQTATIRCANRDFVTLADDAALPSAYFDGRVLDAGSLSLSLPLVPVGGSAIETSLGRVTIDNTDGAFDTVLDQFAAISQQVTIRGGRPETSLDDFVSMFTGRITGVGLSEAELTLDLQSPAVYAQNLYPTSVYTGLGGATGDAELAGVVKPVVLGRVWNMSPVLINAVSLIYQVHDGTIAAVTGVFDGGVALSFKADYANYAALAAAALTGGQYATCLVAGLIRVGGTPAYALTAHVDGAADGGSTVRSITEWLIGQLESALGLTVDADSLDAMPTWVAGWVWNEAFSFSEAISRFTGDGGCYWGADSDGTIRAVTLTEPADPVVSYDKADILAIERTSMPSGYEGIHHRRQVRYQRNWTVQSDGELAATAATRARRQAEWRTATATVVSSAINAIDPEIVETSLYDPANAAALASDLIALHGVSRRMFSVDMQIFGTLPRLGETVRIVYPRFGLVDGAVFRVVSIDLRLADSTMRLLLWG